MSRHGERASPWSRRTHRVLRRLLPPRRGALVLGYHRLADPRTARGADPAAMCVHPERFRAQMAGLRTLGRPVSLVHLVEALKAGLSVRGMIAVTFDDAYEDILRVAVPILEEHRIPATVFFIAGYEGRTFWWDRLGALLPAADPTRPFRVAVDASEFAWPGMGGREQLHAFLHRTLRILDDAKRMAFLDRLAAAWSLEPTPGSGGENGLPRALTREEAQLLLESRWIDAGSHSIEHPALGEVAPARAREEIVRSRELLGARLGREIASFSYPHGSRDDGTDRWVREAGYEIACVSSQDSIRPGTDRYALPRLWVRDRAGGAFSRQIRRYVGRSPASFRRAE